jgi:hypothetical protein
VRVEVSRFNASVFELVSREKERAFLRRADPEFVGALQVEAGHKRRLKDMPFAMARLLSAPTIEITDERWRKLRARISGTSPIVKPSP